MSYASTLAISRDRSLAGALIGNLLGFQAALSVLTLALCLCIGRALFDGTTWTAVVILSLDLVLKSVKSTLRWLLKSFEMFGTEAVALVIERVLILVLGVSALASGHGVAGFAAVFAVVRLFDTLGLFAYVHARVLPLVPSRDFSMWLDLLRKGLPYAYAGAVILLFFQVDAVLLAHMRGPTEVGWYSAPVRVLEGLTLVPRVLGYALIPTMAALHAKSPGSVTRLYARGCKYLLLAGLPVAAFGALCSDPFIPFLFGPDYLPSVRASRILLPAALFMFLSNFGETTLACIDRWRSIVVTSTLALVLNVALNLAWIPAWGYEGAAWATLATEGAYFSMTVIALAGAGHRPGWVCLALRPLLASLVFTGVLWIARGLPLLAASLLASAVFGVATIALGVWDRQERDLLRGLRRGSLSTRGLAS
jgi:O-antigen/teichoic acid export membrane protein